MSQIFDTIISFFKDDEWPVSQIEDELILRTAFQGDNGQWACYARVREDQSQVSFHSVCPVNAQEKTLLAMAEFLTRANFGLIIGNFEMDFDDGEIRYKTSADVEGIELQPIFIKNLVYANVVIIDKYLPGIMAVASGTATPEEAIAMVEGAEE
jgi:hypothetical protein